jgi:hypothetical protein
VVYGGRARGSRRIISLLSWLWAGRVAILTDERWVLALRDSISTRGPTPF